MAKAQGLKPFFFHGHVQLYQIEKKSTLTLEIIRFLDPCQKQHATSIRAMLNGVGCVEYGVYARHEYD